LLLSSRAAGDKPYSLFFNLASAKSVDGVLRRAFSSDALDAPVAKLVEHGREDDPGIPLDQGAGKT
jgi:hypothetical protein